MSSDRAKILVVDDVLDNIEILGGILRQEYDVVIALNGFMALKLADSTPVDLILLDIMMPVMDGYEVCRLLKENPSTKKIPIIFVSAKDEEVDEVRGFELGAVDYITKPVSPAIVRARVKNYLALFSAMKELEKQNSILHDNIRLREDIERISRHDLKGPMTIFLNGPEMLMAAKNQTPDQLELLRLMTKSARRLMEMIHHSLDLYKMEQGTYQLAVCKVDIIKVLREVFCEFASLVGKKNISHRILLEETPVAANEVFELPGEELLFFSIFSNLIKNAIEASPEGEEIVVALINEPVPVVAIKNKGCIPSQIRERFFERYATFGKEHGTGLGVYSARVMTRTMGGDLSFTTSEVEGTALILTMQQGAQLS